jgi:hypothetical protein
MRWPLAVVLTACVSSPSPTPPVSVVARGDFNGDVLPILQAKCAMCHAVAAGIDFMSGDAYETITASPVVGNFDNRAPLLTISTVHAPIALTADEAQRILAWFALEREARGL